MTLYIEAARLGEDGTPEDVGTMRFSLGTGILTPNELKWLNSVTKRKNGQKSKPSFKVITLCNDTVIGWELAVGNLTEVIDTAREYWDVEVKALSCITDVCTVSCREALRKPCECVCGGTEHGDGHGLSPNEVVFGELILHSTYRQVTRYYHRHEEYVDVSDEYPITQPELSWSERIAAANAKDSPDSSPDGEHVFCVDVMENRSCSCGECSTHLAEWD